MNKAFPVWTRSFLLLAAVFFAFVSATPAQNSPAKTEAALSSASVREEKLDSKLLERSVSYRVVLPRKYDKEKGKRYPAVYLLHGLTGHFNNWTDKTEIAKLAFEYDYIIVTPEGADGWYTDSASVAADKYESYIVKELIPEIDRKYRTVADKNRRAIAGLSMGGYGALKFGLKYPEMFILAGSFSGALDAPVRGQNNQFLSPSIKSVFTADVNASVRSENDIFRIINDLLLEKAKNLPFLYFDCGTEDRLIDTNREFAALLYNKKIPHEFRQLPGKHDWNYWNAQVAEFLKVSRKFIAPTKN